MEATTALTDRTAALRAAVAALPGLAEVLHQGPSSELADLVSLCDALAAGAAAARTAVVAEAVRRGDVDSTLSGWVREHAPSLRQGGAGHSASLVTEATKGGPLWNAGTVAPEPDSPTGIVWAATQAPLEAAEPGSGATTSAPLSPGNAMAVLSEMRHLTPLLKPAAVPTVCRILVDLCLEWGPTHMRKLRPRLLAEYGAKGEVDSLHTRLAKAAFLSAPQVEAGALTEYRMGLTPAQAALLEATIGPLSAPAPNPETGERDLRPAGQRRVEALIEVCQASAATALEAGGNGPSGAYAALHVTMALTDLRALTGCTAAAPGSTLSTPASPRAITPAGTPASTPASTGGQHRDDLLTGEVLGTPAAGVLLSPEMLRLVACHADLIPQVLGSHGELLDQGREVRLFNRGQRRRLLRRDKHCTYPGCDRPGAWTRAHHVLHWLDDGPSDLDNGALLCERHHTIVHARRLWAEVRSTPDEHGRFVVWDLTEGSYDRELERRRDERAVHDPPPLTPALLADLAGLHRSTDRADRAWAAHLAAWYEGAVDPVDDWVDVA